MSYPSRRRHRHPKVAILVATAVALWVAIAVASCIPNPPHANHPTQYPTPPVVGGQTR